MTDKAKAFFDACAEGRHLEVQEALREASDAQTHTLLDQDVPFKPAQMPELKLKPLHVAAANGHGEVVKLLVEKGANLDAQAEGGRSALYVAAWAGYGEVVKLLVDKGANLEAQNINGLTALFVAAVWGHGEVVKLLVDKGANLHAQDNEGQTALHMAAEGGHGEVVKLLVDKGANLEAQNRGGQTALHLAAWEGHGEVVKLLVDKGANPDAQDKDGRTALHWAARQGYGEVVKLLVDKGANLEDRDEEGLTALHLAAWGGHGEVVKLLVDVGANLEAQDKDGHTALYWAALRGHGEVVKLLVDKVANLEAQDNEGQTALHMAAANGHGEVVKLLVDKGADLHAQDNDGRTVLHMVLTRNSTDDGTLKATDALVQKHIEKGNKTSDGAQEVLVFKAVFQTYAHADYFSFMKTKLLDSSCQVYTDSLNVLRMFAVLIDSTSTVSFKFSDAEFSKLSKLVSDSLQKTLQLGLFHKPLATLALLAGALGNRARLRAQVREDLIAFRSKVLQLAFAALSIPEMDEQGMALQALGYSCSSDIYTGAFVSMDKITDEGPLQDAPFGFLISQRVSELISVPQLQSSIDKVFYKTRSTAFADFAFFEASVVGGDGDGEIRINGKWTKAEEYVVVRDCLGKPWKFMFQTLFGQWKAQDWRTLPRCFFLSQFLFHCFYFILTVLAFWHADKASWSTSVLIVMTVGYAVEELYQLRSGNGIAHYTDDPWNILDVAFLFSSFVWCASGCDAFLALNLFLVPFRLLHYLSIFKTSGVLVAVLIRMIAATVRFLVFYAVILFGFAAMMFAFFGNKDIDGFDSFPLSCLTLFDASFGNYDFSIFDEMDNYTWAGVALLTIFLLLAAVMALNLLIAVLSEEYSKLADHAYIEWCFMYSQIVQENFVLESRFPDNLKLPPPFSVIFYVARSLVWISQRLQRFATSKDPFSGDGHDAKVETALNPLTENAVPSQPAGLPHHGPEQYSQEPKGKRAAQLAVQLLPGIAIFIVASVDAVIHILIGLPWALIGLYFFSFKVMLGQATVPSYALMLLSFGHLTNSRNDDLEALKEKYGGGFHKLETYTKLLVVTGFMLWLLVGIPLVSLFVFIWSAPLATFKAYNAHNKEGRGSCSNNTEAKSDERLVLLQRIREAIHSCSLTDDGNEFAQVLGEVAKVESQVEAQGGKLEAQGGKLEAQVGKLEAQVGELKAQGGELKAMVARLLEAQGLATPTPAMEESVNKQESNGTGGFASSAAPAGAEEKKSSEDR